MKKYSLLILLISAVFLFFSSCEKKQTTAEKYADTVKSVSSDLTELTDVANTVADLASSLGSVNNSPAPSSSTASTEWKKAMDDYEKFVDNYVSFMKKYNANPTDLSLLTEYASMAEKAETASDSISKVQSDLSGSDLAEFTTRYTKITAKLASVF